MRTRPTIHRRAALGLALLLAAPALASQDKKLDPTQDEVMLPCGPGWRASLVIDNGATGIWTVKSFPLFEQYGCPEVVGLDDRGRCLILVSYSGKWTPFPTIEEKKWLGGLTHDDVDPRIPGKELYTGGQLGNVYQVVAYPHGATDHRLIARFEGREVHTLVSGDLDPRTQGNELLVFTSPGGLYRVTATGPDGTFETTELEQLPGRVRDAIVLPNDGRGTPEIATVSRAGKVELLRIGADGPTRTTLHEGPMGRGRIALAPQRDRHPLVLYTTQDDGVVLRHERASRDMWKTEVIYNGPQGLRGIAAGRFHDDPEVESVAVFGYSGRVELLTRGADGWSVETLFEDRDKGHWLAIAELDGRNGTHEILASGYGGRIVLLSRPAGYGSLGPPVDPSPPQPATEKRDGAQDAPIKVGVMGDPARAARLDPLTYGGGFQAKTLVYETLVLRDEHGRIAPGLASAWRIEDDGRAFVFTLREGARFHDGSPVDAEAVRVHFKRWVGLPEHGWLGASERIRDIVASSPRELRIELDRPYALLPDLCAINPCAIRAPATLDRDGDWVQPMGSGSFRWVDAPAAGRMRLASVAAPSLAAPLELHTFGEGAELELFAAFERGELDLVFDGWYQVVPRARVASLRADPALRVRDAPGSSVWYLSFRLHGGPTSEGDVRRHVLAAIERAELVRDVEHGLADPCTTIVPPALRDWPSAAKPAPVEGPAPRVALRLLAHPEVERERALAAALSRQLERAGFEISTLLLAGEERARALENGDYDLWLEHGWGLPYDPEISLRARCLPPPGTPTAVRERHYGVSSALSEAVARAGAIADEAQRVAVHREIQALIDRDVLFVPLYVPRRVAVARGDVPLPLLGTDLYRTDLVPVVARAAGTQR